MNEAGTARRSLIALLLVSVLLRLGLAAAAPSPGLTDPTYYFNLARSLTEGRGFVIDFLWSYHNPPADVTHEVDYYMPLNALLAAGTMKLGGESVFAALIPSILFGGVLLPLLAYWMAALIGLKAGGKLFAAGAMVFIPELMLNSARTDTTVFFTTFAAFALAAMYYGLARPETRQRAAWLAAAGAATGGAYLVRNDGLLLIAVFAGLIILYAWRRVYRFRIGHVVAYLGLLLIVTAPWLIRNQMVFGTPLTGNITRNLFVTTFLDFFSYGKDLSLQNYLNWGLGNIVSKIGFETLGNIKMMVVLLSVLAPLTLGGALLLGRKPTETDAPRHLDFWLPAALFLVGLCVFYSVFVPFLSQGGSFKKTVMTLLPFGVVLAAWALNTWVQRARAALGIAVCALLCFYGFDLVRSDFTAINTYSTYLSRIRAAVQKAGDTNGDGRIIVMTQDPFQWNYYGFPAAMYPNNDLGTTFMVAEKYKIDYFIFPTARDSLAPIENGEMTDPHLVLVWHGRNDEPSLYRFVPRP